MARARKSKGSARKAVRKKAATANGVDDGQLTKGQLRKLGALRKSLGEQIADKAFAQWLKKSASAPAAEFDRNAGMIADTLGALAKEGKLRLPHGGYLVTRGRGRVIVQRDRDERVEGQGPATVRLRHIFPRRR